MQRRNDEIGKRMIIDSHVHAGEYLIHYPEAFASEMMRAVDRPGEAITTHIPTLLAEMDKVGVDRAFLLAFDAQRTLDVKVPNEYVARICQTHPDRFVGFGSVDAGVPGAAEVVEHCASTLGLQGIKIAPAYVRLSPADPLWYGLYEAAQALKLPVLVHTGFTPSRQAEPRYFPPMLLDKVASDFPDLRLILAHLGTPWVRACLDLLVKHPNLYADISVFGWFQPVEIVADTLSSARARGVLNRLMWGTDRPWGPLTAFRARMDLLTHNAAFFPDGQALTDQEQSGLMGATAQSLLAQ